MAFVCVLHAVLQSVNHIFLWDDEWPALCQWMMTSSFSGSLNAIWLRHCFVSRQISFKFMSMSIQVSFIRFMREYQLLCHENPWLGFWKLCVLMYLNNISPKSNLKSAQLYYNSFPQTKPIFRPCPLTVPSLQMFWPQKRENLKLLYVNWGFSYLCTLYGSFFSHSTLAFSVYLNRVTVPLSATITYYSIVPFSPG